MKSSPSTSRRRITPAPFRFQKATAAPTPKDTRARRQLRAQAVALQRWGRAQNSVAAAQGACYMVMGLWPLTHLQSFEWMTGPKHNAALMQVTGALLAVIGIILLLGSLPKAVSATTCYLGAGVACVLALLATVFVGAGRMPPIYLWDAALESVFVAWWVMVRRFARRQAAQPQVLHEAETMPYTTIIPGARDHTLN